MKLVIAACAAVFALVFAPVASAQEADLSGAWVGGYMQGEAETPFAAVLVQDGEGFIGEMTERFVDSEGQTLAPQARIEGQIKTGLLRFVKTYDGSHGWTHQVVYVGRLSESGDEVTGHWMLPSSGVSGQFRMVRGQ